MIAPKIATEIPATIIVFMPVPSQTMKSGARADFGRELRITRYGSETSEKPLQNHNKQAAIILIRVTRRKLTSVSVRVIPICRGRLFCVHRVRMVLTTRVGELKKKLSIIPKEEQVSHNPRKRTKTIRRNNPIVR